jgi:hypothetical protein
MKDKNHFLLPRRIIVITFALSILLGGCVALRPSRSIPNEDQSPVFIAPTLVPLASPTATRDLTNPNDSQPANCTNQLTYEKDLTLPDGAVVAAGAELDKQWQVKNAGTCNWNETYSVRLISGSDLGVTTPQAIVPARGGTGGVIRIVFTAPAEPGNYTSSWQAFDPSGQAFGDYFSIEINVTAQ